MKHNISNDNMSVLEWERIKRANKQLEQDIIESQCQAIEKQGIKSQAGKKYFQALMSSKTTIRG